MLALLLDTSSDKNFVVLSKDGIVLKVETICDTKNLSKFLLPSIRSLWQGEPLSYIGIGVGPGSFTGTRVGATVAITLAFALEIPIFSFSSQLLPDWQKIAAQTYQKNQTQLSSDQIELVYFSSTT